MSEEKIIKGRFGHMHATEAVWALYPDFVPKQSEFVVYDHDENYDYERFKIGDGVSAVSELPFASNSSASSGMPIIRFVNARFGNDTIAPPTQVVSTSHPLKLTVEIIGGGSLQVGDALQACTRKTYWYNIKDNSGLTAYMYKKQKLRRFAWYTITEEDVGKRFLELELTDDHSYALFRSGSCNYYDRTLSPIYLRIRRPKGELQSNKSGMTVDAEFSNVLTVWKRYGDDGVTIK